MRKITFIFVLLAGCFLLTSCGMETQKGSPINPKLVPPVVQSPAQSVPVSSTAVDCECDQMLIQEKLNAFDRRADDLKDVVDKGLSFLEIAIGFFGIIVAIIGFAVFRERREYKEAVNKAENSAGKACEWEQKAREKYENMEKQINEMTQRNLEKIKNETKEYIKQLFNEAQKQRELSEKWDKAFKATLDKNYELVGLWAEIVRENPEDYSAFNNWGLALSDWADLGGPEAEKRYKEACAKCQRATELKPDFHEAFNNWGLALGKWGDLGGLEAEKHYREACEKFQRATEIKPDKEDAFDNWGAVLSKWADISGSEAEKRYREACEKFQRATEIKPDKYNALSNWGAAFSKWAILRGPEEAEKLYQEACSKYQRATELKPDYHIAFNNWGNVYLLWSRLKSAEEKEKLYQEAERVLRKAEEIKTGVGAYNLACLFALRGDEDKCREWLKIGEEAKTLQTREYAVKDEDLASMRDKDWFKAIRWKGEQ